MENSFKSLDDGFEIKGVFLDISKAFDKVWHEIMIYKLKQNGISGKLLNTIKYFLDSRKQRVVINRQYHLGQVIQQRCFKVQL